MKNKITTILNVLLILLFLYIPHHLIFIKKFAFPISYINNIETNEIPKEYIQFSLNYFNYLGFNKVVKFSGSRPINIIEMPRDSFLYSYSVNSIAGMAKPGYRSCTIYLNPDILSSGFTQVKNTVLHEYLHCLGFSHVDNKADLMYYSSSGAAETSIEGYAETLYSEHIYWTILKYMWEDYIIGIKEWWNSLKS
jgi:hypothetical protein